MKKEFLATKLFNKHVTVLKGEIFFISPNGRLTKLSIEEQKLLDIEYSKEYFLEQKQKRLSYIKQSFNTALSKGYTCSNGITMDADMNSIGMLNSGYTLVVSAGATTMSIRDYNNIVHSIVAIEDVKQMLLELGANFQTQLAKKWKLEEQVNKATTQAELDAIVWS